MEDSTVFFYYTVQKGDTIYNLANEFGSTVAQIMMANSGLSIYNLQVGNKIVIPVGNIVDTNNEYNSSKLATTVNGLKTVYPFLEVGKIGESVLGKPLTYIRIGSGRKEIFYNASFHANELITTNVLLKFIEDYSRAYVNNKSIFGYSARALYYGASLYIVPMVNPDGVDLVTGSLESVESAYQNAQDIANNYPNIPFPSGWKANIDGIDLNLQFPAGWEDAKRIKFSQGFTKPAPRDYVGEGPLTAPESLAVYNFTLEHNFRLIIAYHTQGEVIYWKFQNYNPPFAEKIGRRFENVSGYTLSETPYNSSFAGYKDWFIQNYNRPGYTVEAGLGENPLPISQFYRIYEDNLGILVNGLIL